MSVQALHMTYKLMNEQGRKMFVWKTTLPFVFKVALKGLLG